jgi:two-component system nitrate/nitrite response regulator NarL
MNEVSRSGIDLFRIGIVDRDLMSSDLLVNMLMRERALEAVSLSASELLAVPRRENFDLIVISSELESGTASGFDLASTVRHEFPSAHVVMLLNQTTQEAMVNVFRTGAIGVFSRNQPMHEFFDCVEHVRKGFIWAGRQETLFLLSALKSIPSSTLTPWGASASLSTRELQVVRNAAEGKTNKSIASNLGLSEHTVKNYLFRAFEKLGVTNRNELLFYLTVRGHSFDETRAGARLQN